jgi:hypothetical protein
MAFFYYQIKGRSPDTSESFGNWAWPPVFSGRVEADNKKAAKELVEGEYNRQFPQRVLLKDLGNEPFLLHMREIKEDDKRTLKLFEPLSCNECSATFHVIDKYNDLHESNKGAEFCSHACAQIYRNHNRIDMSEFSHNGRHGAGYIYKVTQISTNQSYIGKTCQAFTLRWYQHFFQSGDTAFHRAIKSSDVTDWAFTVLEIVQVARGANVNQFIAEREKHWITHFNTLNNGLNSVTPIKDAV